MRALDVGGSWLASVVRPLSGFRVRPRLGPRPKQRLILYEFEACPFCRKVREALCELGLEAEIRPCPKGGMRFRPDVVQRGGRALFPYLIDPNTGAEMYESLDIVRYLHEHYGDAPYSPLLRGEPWTGLTSSLASACYPVGMRALPSSAPGQPLELYSFEASPYSRIARATLCALELPYVLHNVAKQSPSRPAFRQRAGRVMVPYLVDPNTGREMFESADIKAYLLATYGIAADAAPQRGAA